MTTPTVKFTPRTLNVVPVQVRRSGISAPRTVAPPE